MKKTYRQLFSLSLCGLLFFAVGCEEPEVQVNKPLDTTSKARMNSKGQSSNSTAIYIADLKPLNNSGVTGTATFFIHDDEKFHAKVHAKGLAPKQVHPQHIHGFVAEGTDAICPPESASGDDALLSLGEGFPFYGPIIVPLDSELVPLTQQAYPVANPAGVLNYNEIVGLETFLQAFDAAYDGNQGIDDLDLTKRVVVVHGAFVKDGMIVPPGTKDAVYEATLPVACGEIMVRTQGK